MADKTGGLRAQERQRITLLRRLQKNDCLKSERLIPIPSMDECLFVLVDLAIIVTLDCSMVLADKNCQIGQR